MKSSRRTFLITSIGLASSLAVTRQALAEDPKLDDKDPAAQALGYKHDAATVDKAKYPQFVAGSDCGNCQLFQGGTAEWGACPLFAGKQVSRHGWCSAYAKKA